MLSSNPSVRRSASDADADTEGDTIEFLAGTAVVGEAHIHVVAQVGIEPRRKAVVFREALSNRGCDLFINRRRPAVAA